jgi:hypothetical protein
MAGYLIPALGEWMERNAERAQAPGRQRALERAETLMGAPMRPDQTSTGADGLTTSMPGFGGTGLMENPQDFQNQMGMAMGLMATPYYEQAGQNFMSQSVDRMLQAPRQQAEAQQAQSNWQAEQAQRAQQNRAQQQQARATASRANNVAYANQSNALYDDAQALLKAPRQAIALFDNVQTTVRDKGFSGMSITDDTVMVKSLAKLLLPDEAVMEGDITALATMGGLPAVVKSLAGKIGAGIELLPGERQQLYDQLHQLGQQKMQQYTSDRGDFEARAQKRGIDVNDVLNTAITADMADLNPPQPGTVSPELNAQLDAQYEAENPGIFDQIVTGWENFRR